MLWQVDIYPADGQPDLVGARVAADAAELPIAADLRVAAANGYLIQADLDQAQVTRLARELLADEVVERFVVAPAGDAALDRPPDGQQRVVHVLPKPGVMDPVAQSALAAIADFNMQAEAVRTLPQVLAGRSAGRQAATAVRQAAGERRDRAGHRRAHEDGPAGVGRAV